MNELQAIGLLAGAGLGTYLLRYLPMRWYVVMQSAFKRPNLRVVLAALGPAAIVALLVVSLKGLIDFTKIEQSQADLVRIAFSLFAIWLSHKRFKNTIIATFIGVAIYAGILWWQNL